MYEIRRDSFKPNNIKNDDYICMLCDFVLTSEIK